MLRVTFLIIPLFAIVFNLRLRAQDESFFLTPEKKTNSFSNSCLFFRFDNLNFLKNNEYFNPIDEGITFLGATFNPRLALVLNKNFTIIAGWYGFLYSGRDKMSLSIPYYNVTWNFTEGYFLKMGNINGFHNHRLPEPLFSFDRIYSTAPETGVQITADRKHHSTDIWLSWEKYILPGDDFKEEFVMGGRSFIFLKPSGSKGNIALSLNGIAAHKGGQVGSPDGRICTLMNSAVGILAYLKPIQGSSDSIGIRNDFYGFKDVSPVKQQLYSMGWGNYTTVFTRYKGFYFEGGLWYGKHYIATRGEWLFQSVSNLYTVYWEPSNLLITAKGGWMYSEDKPVNVGIGGGCYYDTYLKNLDFYYQFHIYVRLSYLLKELSGK